MFGILKPDSRLIPPFERTRYSKLYCNLCGSLSESYGVSTRLLAAYDLVTLAWLFGDRDEWPERFRRLNCMRGGTFLPRLRSDRPEIGSWQHCRS